MGFVCGNAVVRIIERHHTTKLWKHLFQDLKTFYCEVLGQEMDASEPPSGIREALHKPKHDRITPDAEDDGDMRCPPLYC